LKSFVPLIEEGGFIPTVDHTVPPDVSLENFKYYIEKKKQLLNGTLS
jgi:uroporphyrinogen decarboxylase